MKPFPCRLIVSCSCCPRIDDSKECVLEILWKKTGFQKHTGTYLARVGNEWIERFVQNHLRLFVLIAFGAQLAFMRLGITA
jgi:hypothetical protein